MDVVHFINGNMHNISLELLGPEKDGKVREMSFTRLEKLLYCHDEELCSSTSVCLLVPDVILVH
jgi:hypothetical protein